ncbi:LytTR family transcriptional regulator DNA-binding domain-containing protein [Paenibacillus sp. FJAT-26967]|uniref:LytTR family transcriptional regulator DNA-binding domain-containing protein n=1 Tax=Paenibacillus sp. FJAT-26967 TaxID=1729690 RepID=UPI00083870DC|nr:LytTR family transcriptional regulator DNA-binding domain-containing protein [Paenibacillus sp. FJAT-26967]
MAVLAIKDLEKYTENMIVFPAFSLEISQHDVIALYSSMNVRHTLLHMLLGKIAIYSGEIQINQQQLSKNKARYFAQIGFSLLDDGMYERLTVKENLVFFKKLYDSPFPIEEVMRTVQLEMKTNIRVSKLSVSEKKRVQYARLLCQNPALHVYEEPEQNVDNETKMVFQKMVRGLSASGKSILVLTGNMETALSLTNRVYRLDHKGLHAFDIADDQEQDGLAEQQEVTAASKKPEAVTGTVVEHEPAAGEAAEAPDTASDAAVAAETANDEDDAEPEVTSQPVRFGKIPTKMNDKIILFDPPEIDYIESSEGQSNIYIKGDVYPSAFKINELEERLRPYGFFRCHRSYIVNLQKVKEIVTWTRNSYSLILEDQAKSSVPLSKTKMAELKEMLGLK